jgi:hypothetical protein
MTKTAGEPGSRPVIKGTIEASGSQADHVIPTLEPSDRDVPATGGTAPTFTSGGLPGTDDDTTGAPSFQDVHGAGDDQDADHE